MKYITIAPILAFLLIIMTPRASVLAMTLDDVTGQLSLYKQEAATYPKVLGANSSNPNIPSTPILPPEGSKTLLKALVYTKGSATIIGAPLKLGMTNGDVKVLQVFLNTQGFDLPTTGKYGPLTQKAVKAFQANHGIKSNGALVGPATTAAITSVVSTSTSDSQ